jgi:diguanylate cyclase (GGDEF)-like protein
MVDFVSLEPRHMDRFLERRRIHTAFPAEMSLAANLEEILRKANEFVPSRAGSILLDDPLQKVPEQRLNELTFIAVFGEKAHDLVGRRIPATAGIVGRVYRSGTAYFTGRAQEDESFFPGVDALTRFETQTLVAIPIRVEQEVCGVLELVNRRGEKEFSAHDCNLLEIFAGYISISIQNVLDGRQAQEIAKRDNLTGLFNDRYLHIGLSRAIGACREEGRDLALVFMDLDYFKRVNDTHGHLAGSRVLREVGGLLASLIDIPEAIVCRYGGDEFVVAVPGCDLAVGVDLAERVREAILDQTFCSTEDAELDSLNLTGITCSCGVATLQRHVEPSLSVKRAKATLLKLADSAMYVAKETGRNRTAIVGEPVRRRSAAAD